jgi:hypothetical protein
MPQANTWPRVEFGDVAENVADGRQTHCAITRAASPRMHCAQ